MPYGSNVSTFMLPLDAIQLLQAAFGKAKVESDVQAATMTFFDVLLDEFLPGFFVRDTSSKGLKNPMAKPDIILLAENEASKLCHPLDFVSALFLCLHSAAPLVLCCRCF